MMVDSRSTDTAERRKDRTARAPARPRFYEFFAGGGMARAGLGEGWTCLFANDVDAKKCRAYQANWGEGELKIADVRDLQAADLPGRADLVWGSFPCQDLSLAGIGAGLKGARSGTFYPFWDIVRGLVADGRAPKIVAVENVVGALTSHDGRDFAEIASTFASAGYRFGGLVIDAALFTPQSRPRLFVIGVRTDVEIDPRLVAPQPIAPFHTPAVQRAFERVDEAALRMRLWWRVPGPPLRNTTFAEIIEETPTSVTWRTEEERDRLLSLMSPLNRAKIEEAKSAGRRIVGCVYRRTRLDERGRKTQRAEVRFDDVAGCLRTPAGGSSRQIIIIVEGESVRMRLISARETARLMGLAEDYILPENYNEAYHLTGDGVVAPVVRHLAEHIFEPLLRAASATRAAA